MVSLLFSGGICGSAEISTFHAYVDSDLCARLMLGPITSSRIECSQKTFKEGSNPVLVRLLDNTVFDVNKQKMVNDHVGKLAEVTGEAKVKSGTIKLQSVKPEEASSIPQGDPARLLLDVRTYRTQGSADAYEKVRHELAMMPYITTYDFICFTMVGNNRAMTSTSGPGLSLMTEYAGLAYFAEVPIVVWDVQRVGPSTGLPTRTAQGDLRFAAFMGHGDQQHIVLLPGSAKECFEFGWKAFHLAEHVQAPVFVLIDLDFGMNQWMTDHFTYPDQPMNRGKILWESDLAASGGVWAR